MLFKDGYRYLEVLSAPTRRSSDSASGAYTRAIQKARPQAEIYTRACPLLVPLVEEEFLVQRNQQRTGAGIDLRLRTSFLNRPRVCARCRIGRASCRGREYF